MTESPQPTGLSATKAAALAEEAFVFGMPLVYIALQIQTNTYVEEPTGARAPLNQFAHFRELPGSSDQVVVGLNVDTLYSLGSIDLADEPLVLSVPEMGDRYWLMQLVDAWNNVPHVPGTRTVGSGGGDFAIVGPDWSGELPPGVTELRMPTNLGVVGGRVAVTGPEEYAGVHALQDGCRLVPLSAWGTGWIPPAEVALEGEVDIVTPVPRQVLAMTPEVFFARLNALLPRNPPYAEDAPVMDRIARLGIGAGADFPWSSFDPEVQDAISQGVAAAKDAIHEQEAHLGERVNGWQMAFDMGRYGTKYTYRAAWTFFGVGGNLIEDACYPLAVVDGTGEPLDSVRRYRVHFAPGQLPPVDAFWSLTMYDAESYLVANSINRYALGDRSELTYGDDGSLTIHIQRDQPDDTPESNWLPAPAEGRFKLALRLYSPKPEVAQRGWDPADRTRRIVEEKGMFTPTGPTEVRRVTAPEPPPPAVETRFAGRLEFEGGFPTEETLARLYDQLDFQRACQVFLRHMMGASMWGFRQSMRRDLGLGSLDVAMIHLDAAGLLLTGNSETIYGIGFLDLAVDGPVVIDVPPGVLGLLNDQWMRPLGDVGLAGPDHGKGGSYLVVPPGHEDDLPAGDFVAVVHPRTYGTWLALRAFMGPGGDPAPGFATLEQVSIRPVAAADDAPATRHINASGVSFDTIHPVDSRYFDDLAAMVEHEHEDAIEPELAAQLAQIGISKGTPFAPDERMRGILDEAASVASVMAFGLANAPRTEYRRWPDREWFGLIEGYPTFRDDNGRPMVDAMVQMAWFATGRASAMGNPKPGTGSAYTWAYRDAHGDWIDPRRSYRLRLPGPVPAKNFWSVVVYDLWTRSMLANGQKFPSLNSYAPDLVTNEDGSVDVYIGPEPPPTGETNWRRTRPDTGWVPLLRLDGPEEPWFDLTWKPGALEPVED